MKNKLIIFTGPSGVGKGTIEKILFQNKGLKLKLSCSATTRKPRAGEVDGKDYFFLTPEQFEEKIKNNEFIEWNKHFNNYYGTLSKEVDNILESNHNAFLEIETVGALNVLDFYKKQNKRHHVISIFVMPPSIEELTSRIINRGTESPEELELRIEKARQEVLIADKFDHIVVNGTLEKVSKEIEEILIKGLN